MANFKLILISSLVMFLQLIDCSCGPPGIPVGADVHGFTSVAQEEQTIRYTCKNSFKQVYDNVRTCVRGQWTPRIPKCAIKESSRLMVENYKVNYFDIKESTGLNENNSFEYIQYIKLNSSRRFTFQVHYSPNARLSYVELDLQIQSKVMPSNLKVSLFINEYRNCLTVSQIKIYSVIELQFICESKTDIDYEIEGKDTPDSLKFSFESNIEFLSRIIRISVFRFQEGCGSPDIPLNAKSTIDSGNTVRIYPIKPKRYKIWGRDFDSVKCLNEGNWDKQFKTLYPLISCPYDGFNWNSLNFKNVSLEYFEYYNDTLYAAVDSKIIFQCNNTKNSSLFHYLYCQENGQWTSDQKYLNVCNIEDKNKTNGHFLNQSNFYVMIVTLLSTFLSTLFLTIIFASIIVWRRKALKKRKEKNLNVKYVKESESYADIFGNELSYTTDHYEAIDYQAISSIDVNEERQCINSNHDYVQILN